MKYVRIQLNDEISYGIVEGEKVIKINGNPILEDCKETGETYNLSEVKIFAFTTFKIYLFEKNFDCLSYLFL